MVCTSLNVTSPAPSVGVVVDSTGFTQEGLYIGGTGCSVAVSDITGTGKYLGAAVTIRVSGAKAKFDIKFDYTLDTVAKTFTAVGVTQDIGDITQYVATTTSYVKGFYKDLTASVLNVTAG
jgi:hypothetical protein